MRQACLVTDNSAQFSKPNFPGQNLIHIVPLDLQMNGQRINPEDDVKANLLPKIVTGKNKPQVSSPSADYFYKKFQALSFHFDPIIAIFLSSGLNKCYQNAVEAAETIKGKADILIIDSKTTSVGLGLLIMSALEAIRDGHSLLQIDRKIRNLLPHLYTLFCIPSLSYLQYNGFLDETQAVISEMLGVLPIFSLEDGQLTPIEKVKSVRHSLGYYQEFLEEFDQLDHVAYVQSAKTNFKDAKIFQDNVQTIFPELTFSKHIINLPLSILLGPRSSSLIALEKI